MLTREEAICFVLKNSKNNFISGRTKLNKLVARLNLYLIAVDVEFTLNQYGSYSEEIQSLKNTPFFKWEKTSWGEALCSTKEGFDLGSKIELKLKNSLSEDNFNSLLLDIRDAPQRAKDVADDEHATLLVDSNERYKLRQKLNENEVNYLDLYDISKSKKANSLEESYLKGIVEFFYNLAKFLNKSKSRTLNDNDYDFKAYMDDYYFIYLLAKEKDFLKNQLSSVSNSKRIILMFDFIIEKTENYPFSVFNPNLDKLLVR